MAERTDVETAVAGVIRAVRERGDEAVCELAARWDQVRMRPEDLRVPAERIAAARGPDELTGAFRRAAERIRRFHEAMRPRSTVVDDPAGARLEMRWTPLAAVGLYIPGGKASYPSTVAMTAVPAQVAGVSRIAVVSPPGKDGEVSAEVLLAARELGITEVYRVGGAQAVAALALGTASIPRVDKVFGPGNAYVTEAKRQLFGIVGVDLLAGPSEIVVYADSTAEPEWVAADLLAQAEHDESTRPILLAATPAVLSAVRAALDRRLGREPRRETIRAALERNGVFEVAATIEEAARRIDAIAPEHLSIQCAEPRALLSLVRNAGAVYVGGSSPVALGDYYAGPNHVLPTGGAARFASCLSVEDFMKRTSIVEASTAFLRAAAPDVEALARAEGLPAHASSIAARRSAGGARPGLRSAPPYGIVEEEAQVKLNQNEAPWDVPDEVKERILKALRDLPWHRYPQRLPEELRRRIAADEGISPEGVWLGNGSNLILQWIFEAFGGPGRSALVPRPSFSLYGIWGRVSETRVEELPLDARFQVPVDLLIERVRQAVPSLVVLCLPNNPTGNELPLADVERIADAAERTGGLLVVDEAYREFSREEFDRTRLARERPNVVLVRTYSKAFAAAGLRLGYVLAPAEVGRELGKIVPPFHLSQFAAVAGSVLWDERPLFQERAQRIVEERERLRKALGGLRGVEPLPSHANFFLIRVGDAKAVFQALRERGVLLRLPGEDPALVGLLRVTVGTPEENGRLLSALREVLDGR